jgi:hypothetical protein
MAPPTYAATASLYTTSLSYRRTRSGSAAFAAPTVIAQQDPCALPGHGNGHHQPHRCATGQRCCEPAPGGLCWLCAPAGAQCP